MSETTTLRQLSRDYAQGRLTLAQYREQRARLLDSLHSGTTPLTPYHPPVTPPVDLGERSSTTLQGIRLTALPPPPVSSRRPWWLAAVAVAVVVIGAGIFFLRGEKPAAPVAENSPAAPESPPPAATPPATAPSAPLVEDFLRNADWGKERLDRFLADWAALTEGDRASLSQSSAYRDLADGTYSQIIKEQALLGLGDDKEVLDRQEVLIHFADQVGFSDNRFKEAAANLAKLRAAQTASTTPPVTPTAAAPPPPAPTTSPQVAENTATTPPPPPAAPAPAKEPAATKPAAAPETAAPAAPVTPPAAPPVAAPAPTSAEIAAAAPPAAAATATTAPESTAKKTAVAEKTPAETEKAAPTENAAEAAAAKPEATETAAPETKATTKQKKTLECYADLAKERKPFCRDGMSDGGVGPLLAVLPAGEFSMGGGGAAHAEPAHKVTIPNSIAMSLYEISSGEFEIFCKATGRSCPPQPWQGTDYPVVNVSWADATAYAEWLSKATGHPYRLPTEAEWEYGARAGSTTRYPFGDELLPTHARFSYQGPVDSPMPRSDHTINRNNFRLYHMIGNVREWVQDGWHDSYQGAPADGKAWEGSSGHPVRGGCYKDRAEALTSASRESGPAQGDDCTGFRVVEDIPAHSSRDAQPVAKKGQAWATAQGQNQYTLQLFAVQSLKQVEKLMARYPRLELMIVPSEDPALPYKVYYGLFDSKEGARTAWGQLPRALIKDNPKPFIQSFAQIQRSFAGR